MIAVTDTGPLQYLIQTNAVAPITRLYDRVLIPQAVREELFQPNTPALVRAFCSSLPAWFEIHGVRGAKDQPERHLGEREAIALATTVNADWLLLDDAGARRIAHRDCRSPIVGTVGVLSELSRTFNDPAMQFGEYVKRLRDTSFYFSDSLNTQIGMVLQSLR